MADFPALPVWTDAYLSDLLGVFTLEEHGCMFLLMQASWRRRECNLPDDDKYFCRFLGIHGNAWRHLKKRVLHRLWETEERDGETFWYHKRLRKERDFVEKRHRNAVEKGSKGGRVSRKNKDITVSPAEAPTPTPTVEEETPSTVSNTETPPDRTIPTQPLAPRENSRAADWPRKEDLKFPELAATHPKNMDRKSAFAKQIVFDGEIIRLNRFDYESWRRRYPRINDIRGFLEHIDGVYAEMAEEDPKIRKGWFFRTQGWLNKKSQELASQNGQPQTWWLKEKRILERISC